MCDAHDDGPWRTKFGTMRNRKTNQEILPQIRILHRSPWPYNCSSDARPPAVQHLPPPSCALATPPYPHRNPQLNFSELIFPGPSRCFPFWQEVLACYVTNTSPESDAGKIKCQPVLEDYYECLHHKKEVRHLYSPAYPPRSERFTNTHGQAARTIALQAAYRKAEANIKRDDAPSAGEIRRLGVLDAPLEEKNLKASKWFPHKEIN